LFETEFSLKIYVGGHNLLAQAEWYGSTWIYT